MRHISGLTALLICGAAIASAASLKSAGALAFGPDGILFIGDSIGGAVVAVDTGDKTPASAAAGIEIKDLDHRLAGALGIDVNNILLHDIKVNPVSKNIYLSVSRGRGPDA